MKKLAYIHDVASDMINALIQYAELTELEGTGKDFENEIYKIEAVRKDGKIIIKIEQQKEL